MENNVNAFCSSVLYVLHNHRPFSGHAFLQIRGIGVWCSRFKNLQQACGNGGYQQVPPSVNTTRRFPWYLTRITVNKKRVLQQQTYFSFLRHNSARISLLGSIMATHQSQKMYSEPTLINAYLIGNRLGCLFSFWW